MDTRQAGKYKKMQSREVGVKQDTTHEDICKTGCQTGRQI